MPRKRTFLFSIAHLSLSFDYSSYSLSPWTDRGFGPPYAFSNIPKSSPSTTTTSSHITSNYTSGRSSQRSDLPRTSGSSTTLHDSSQQSDSLYNQPTTQKSARIVTTSFNNDQRRQSRMKYYRDLSTPRQRSNNHPQSNQSDIDRRPITSSNIDVSSSKFSFDHY